MHIRDARISDIPRLASIFLTCIRDDADYEALYPWRASEPDYFAQLMTNEITHDFIEGRTRFLVVETPHQQVAGWACWTRMGSSTAAERIRAESDSTLKALERTLLRVQGALGFPFARMFCQEPALHMAGRMAKHYFVYNDRLLASIFVGEAAEHWRLEKVCVDPEWRRRGVATVLLKWGQKRAREEGLLVCSNATGAWLAMYRKEGFVQVETCEIDIESDGLDIAVPVMLWRPESMPVGGLVIHTSKGVVRM